MNPVGLHALFDLFHSMPQPLQSVIKKQRKHNNNNNNNNNNLIIYSFIVRFLTC